MDEVWLRGETLEVWLRGERFDLREGAGSRDTGDTGEMGSLV